MEATFRDPGNTDSSKTAGIGTPDPNVAVILVVRT